MIEHMLECIHNKRKIKIIQKSMRHTGHGMRIKKPKNQGAVFTENNALEEVIDE